MEFLKFLNISLAYWVFGTQVEKAKVIQTLLFVSGLNTLFQSLFGTRLPVVVVGSHAYLIPTISIVLAKRYASLTDPQDVILCYFSHYCIGSNAPEGI